jgi:hypothetical protein
MIPHQSRQILKIHVPMRAMGHRSIHPWHKSGRHLPRTKLSPARKRTGEHDRFRDDAAVSPKGFERPAIRDNVARQETDD